METVRIRAATLEDSERILELGNQLGYPNEPHHFPIRLNEILSHEEHSVVVAELSPTESSNPAQVVAVAHFKIHRGLFVESSLEVAALIVDEKYRGHGLGKTLMKAAEDAAVRWNLPSIRLTSNIAREEAHAFYKGLGYQQPKTSHYFVKPVEQNP